MSDWNAQVIAEFRANDGKVAQFGDSPLLILHTIGAKTGKVREVPLVTLVQGDEFYLFASKGGATTNPDWYFNLKANPEIDVELGATITGAGIERIRAELVQLDEETAATKIREMAEEMAQFAEYVESAKPRAIPGFQLIRK